jgi:hypothetical protein
MAQRFPAALLVLAGAASAFSCSSDTESTPQDTSSSGAPGSKGGAGGNAELGSGGSAFAQCPSDQRFCEQDCVNPSTDTNHCGSCGNACVAGQSCVTGNCVCMGDTTLCGGQCVDTDVNVLHCGRCNSPCHDGVCKEGVCLPAVGGAGGADQQSGGVGAAAAGGYGGGGSGGAAGKASGGTVVGTGGSRAGAGGAELGGSTGGYLGGMGGGAGSQTRTGGAGGKAGAGGGPTGGYSSWYTCPAVRPGNGDSCSISGRGALAMCSYDECPAGTIAGPRYSASCPSSPSGSTWTVQDLGCPQAIECGECPPGLDCSADCSYGEACGTNQCPVGQTCHRMVYPDDHWNWGCVPNDCQPLDCSCARDVCGKDLTLSPHWQCTAADDSAITCECVDGC